MLPRLLRMSAGDVRFLFRQKYEKIHARHLSAHVFFLPEKPGPRFAVLLAKGSYANSVDMHRRRRLVYAGVASALAQQQKDGRLLPGMLCGLKPKESFFALTPTERCAAVTDLVMQVHSLSLHRFS